MKATLFDYGAGNLHSLGKALTRCGAEVTVETDPCRAVQTELLVLPGVGAFGAAALRLAPGRSELRAALEAGLPCLGVCLGMQLLFEESEEGQGAGIGLFAGRVTRLSAHRVPHIGWSEVVAARRGEEPPLPIAYYAHGFACRPRDEEVVAAWTTVESDRFPAVVRRGKVLGVQFHPEKSSRPGLAMLARFVEEVKR